MQYQLVLQFDGESETDLDRLIAIEDQLIEVLADSALVDGHDIGSGESNIFIITEHPDKTFETVNAVLGEEIVSSMRVGFRDIDADEYVPIWPTELKSFKVI